MDGQAIEAELFSLLGGDAEMRRFAFGGEMAGVRLRAPGGADWVCRALRRRLGGMPDDGSAAANALDARVDPEDLARERAALARFAHDPAAQADEVLRCSETGGATIWLRARSRSVPGAEPGDRRRVLTLYSDISPRMRAERRSRSFRRRLSASDRELRAVAYALSHELKAPAHTLGLLLNELDLQLGATGNDEARQMLGMAKSTARRLGGVVAQMLDYAVATRHAPGRARVELGPLVRAVAAPLEAAAGNAGAIVEVGALPAVAGCPGQLSLLFSHLLGNALKFRSRERPCRVEVRAGRDSRTGRCRVLVGDNGIGIASADTSRIFEMFARLHPYEQFPGDGLGLTICNRIAANHGGRITVASVPGSGSTFSITLRKART